MKHHTLTRLFLLPLAASAIAGCGGNQASTTEPSTTEPQTSASQAPGAPASDSAASNAASPGAQSSSSGPQAGSRPVAGGTTMSGSGYKISVPRGWKNGAAAAPKMVDLVVTAPPKEQFAANLNVVVVPSSPGETLEAAKKQLPTVYPRMFTKYAQLKQGAVTVDGEAGMTNTANHTTGTPPRKLWMHQAFFIRGGKVYTVTCTALDSNHAQYEADFNAMINSLKWS